MRRGQESGWITLHFLPVVFPTKITVLPRTSCLSVPPVPPVPLTDETVSLRISLLFDISLKLFHPFQTESLQRRRS